MSADEYEIRIRGVIGDAVVERFGEFDIEVEPVQTVLRGPVSDQSALLGLLGRIQALGLELIEIKQVAGRAGRPLRRTTQPPAS